MPGYKRSMGRIVSHRTDTCTAPDATSVWRKNSGSTVVKEKTKREKSASCRTRRLPQAQSGCRINPNSDRSHPVVPPLASMSNFDQTCERYWPDRRITPRYNQCVSSGQPGTGAGATAALPAIRVNGAPNEKTDSGVYVSELLRDFISCRLVSPTESRRPRSTISPTLWGSPIQL